MIRHDYDITSSLRRGALHHSKTKRIEIRNHFIRDSYEKRLIQVIKIHIDHNVVDLLTKEFDVSSLKMALVMNLELKLVVTKVSTAEQKLVLNGCLDCNETAANDEIQVSTVGLTYYWFNKVVGLDLVK
uniref:Putative ribonuclease H-like domain-containing protein n=1 Tax=Tanacetum cinerariifolium TaxID=118510 RepID=A0A699SHH7_TANCI|nr:putative ribonuclease H-like domain-containing protein [Tanacetum cinerariifolium]